MKISIGREIKRNRLISEYKRLTGDYEGVLYSLHYLSDLAGRIGEMGIQVREDLEYAENHCKDCIHRFNILIDSLERRDYRYIDNQTLIAVRQCQSFGQLSDRIQEDVNVLAKMFDIKKQS